jgi:uncharacterized protein YhaN
VRLTAYGPFTDTTLDLSAGREGLHVIYGPNEAGKSSALRALRRLLYGIPERSTDDFLHPYAKMRIGAAIQSGSGEVLEFIRRKGRTGTLRAADDQTVIEDSVLDRFLDGVDGSLFETMFGIGYADLVRGGREIVQGGGNLGQVIFAAGSGITNLREVQTELRSEADRLFRPSGQKPIINETLGLINKMRRDMRDAELPGQQWEKHDQALRQAGDRIAVVENNLSDCQRQVHRLERIREALPIIAKTRNLQKEHTQYAEAVLLPDEFPKQRRDLLTRLQVAQNDHSRTLSAIKTNQKAVADLGESDTILEKAALIEELYRELGSQHKAARDRIKLQTLAGGLKREAGDILRSLREDLTVEDADMLRIKKPEVIRIRELGAVYERVNTRIDAARESIPKLIRRISDLDDQIKKSGATTDVGALKDAVDRAQEYISVEKHCRSELSDIQSALDTLSAALSKQNLWSGSVEELERLPVPQMETVRLFKDRAVELAHSRDRLREELEKIADRLDGLERRIEELQMQQEVPTENDLKAARESRNLGWRLIVEKLEGRPSAGDEVGRFIADFEPASTLTEAFQTSFLQTDEIADRLRREADRVASKARMLADRNASEKQRASLEAALAEVEKKRSDWEKEWLDLWRPPGITPRSPGEMQVWIQNHLAAAEKATAIREKKIRVQASQKEIDRHIEALNQCLQALAAPRVEGRQTLGDLINTARSIIKQADASAAKREQLVKEKAERKQDLVDAQLRVESSEKALTQWRADWEAAVRPLGLGADAVPPQANAVIEEQKELFEKLKEVEILQKRIEGIDRDKRQFNEKVSRLVQTAAGDLADLPAEEAVAELNARLTRARTIQSKRQTLEEQLEIDRARADRAAAEIAAIEARLEGMCREAGCSGYEDLPEAERCSLERRRIESVLSDLEERLLQLGGGAAVESFIEEASAVDPDGIDGEIGRLTEMTDKLNREKSALNRTIGEESNELSKMDGGAGAADLAEEIQVQLGRLEKDVEQYVRLKIAVKLLGRAIERYRSKSQDPILNRAAALFRQITTGSFEGVRADFDGSGQPVLVGVRPGSDGIVTVEGMSDGTADQLYLSLRLAGLEDYLDKNEAIPFIVDDILIKFDDERAAAALKALARLSARTQVIFFTHHRHLVELAEKNVPSPVLITHTL